MDNYGDLPQQIEEFLRQVQKPRTPLLQDPGAVNFNLSNNTSVQPAELSDPGDESVCEDFFDWARWGNEHEVKEQSAARSNSPSMPGLTSSITPPPSEEGGRPSSSRNAEDPSQFKAKLNEAKAADDRYTFPPQREIRPKHRPGALSQYQVHSAGSNSTANIAGASNPAHNGSLPSPPRSRESSADRRLPQSSNGSGRGKRTGKLKNADEVADVRAMGACLCCRLRKVKCDDQHVCLKCVQKATKYKSGLSPITGQQICFRNPFPKTQLLFPHISKTELKGSPAAWRPRPNDLFHPLHVYFGSAFTTSCAITISVVAVLEHSPSGENPSGRSYKLNLNDLPQPEQLCQWASGHTLGTGTGDLQAALDMLTLEYSRPEARLPRRDLVAKVHEMRCLYKVWSQKEFLCQKDLKAPPQPLPKSLQMGLRNLAKSGLKRLESEIIEGLDKSLHTVTSMKDNERLAFWASMMQMILMYRDLFGLTESIHVKPGHAYFSSWYQMRRMSAKLFSTLVVMCEVCFSKKKPDPIDFDSRCDRHAQSIRRSVNENFDTVEARRTEYFDCLDPKPGSLEQLLYILGSDSPSKKQPAAKRRKTSG